MKILPAQLEDARAIAELHVRSWQRAYQGLMPDAYLAALSVNQRENGWVEALLGKQAEMLVAVQNQAIVGFLSFGAARDDADAGATAEIAALYVKPSHWRKGIGSALWRECCVTLQSQGYRSLSLWVVAGNFRGIGFFEKMGCEQEDGRVEACEIGGVTLIEQRYRLQFDN